ncbi:MAG TPA: Lrp/AsnC family transcriptional regulator [Rhizobiales bacterium]|nr:Lrp/AsnC family transcriptional regulator [Hyphomicrobiales bacterium]
MNISVPELDETDKSIINALQGDFPIEKRPFLAAARQLGLGEEELISRLSRLVENRALSRFGPLFNAQAMGGAVTLAALRVPAERFDEVADLVNAHPEVAHNYEREHALNMWFVIATEKPEEIQKVIADIENETGLKVYNMPKEEEFFIGLKVEL